MRRSIYCFFVFALASIAAGSIRVRVVDPHGALVPGARISVRNVTAESGPDGTAELAADPPFELRVEAPGFEPEAQRFERIASQPVTVRLRPAIVRTSIDVTVRDEGGLVTVASPHLEIDRAGARTVLDAVDRVVPAAFVTRRGVMGYGVATNGTGGLSIRGIGESPNVGVLIVVDGRPDFQGLMGHPLPDFYSLSDAGSVTVVEGPASVLYGSNAMGGVVEVKNWAPSEGMTTRLTTSFGSFYTGQHRLSHGARFRRGYYSFNAGLGHTSGDRPSSDFRSQDGTVTAGYDLSPVWKASVEGRYGHFHVEDPGPETAPLANSYARVGRGGFSANLDNATSRTWGYFRAFSSFGLHYLTDGFRSTDRTTGFRVDQNFALAPGLVFEVGSDVVDYGGRARNVNSRLDYGAHGLTSLAGFSRAQWNATHRLRLHSGFRVQRDSVFGVMAAPEIGASYALAGGYSVSMDIAKGFRNPTIRELYLFPAPNPLLQPEHLWNYQASFHARPLQTLAASVTAFYADLSNLIVVTGRYPNLRLLNTDAALNRGFETTARWRAQKRVSVQTGYAYLRSTNLAPYLPANKVNYGVEFDAGRAFVYFGGTSAGERWANTQHTSRLSRYHLGTLKLTIPVSQRWRVFTTVDNLFNRRYEILPGYPMPGVNAAGGATIEF